MISSWKPFVQQVHANKNAESFLIAAVHRGSKWPALPFAQFAQ
jgi:hypothetical protein